MMTHSIVALPKEHWHRTIECVLNRSENRNMGGLIYIEST